MTDWIANNIHTILVIITPLITSLVIWAVRTHFKLKNVIIDVIKHKREQEDEIKEIYVCINDKVDETNNKMEVAIEGLREDLKTVKQENEIVSNQIRDDIKGVQQNIRDLTLQVTRLLGYLEGKKIIEKVD